MKLLKNDLNKTFADVVKGNLTKEIKSVNTEVKNVCKKLEEESENKRRENNIMIFGLKEFNSFKEENEVVVNMFKTLSGNVI